MTNTSIIPPYTLEDFVNKICHVDKPILSKTDHKLFKSLNKQITKRQLPFTDEQCALIHKKVIKYKSILFDSNIITDMDFVHVTKYPVRIPDREKSIKLLHNIPHSPSILLEPAIAIKSPYKRSVMRKINILINKYGDINYFKSGNTYYFSYNESKLVFIIEIFHNMNFQIDNKVQYLYDQIKQFNKKDCLISIVDWKIHNAPSSLSDHISSELGPLNEQTLLLYQDRAHLYGISYIDKTLLEQTKKHFNETTFLLATRHYPSVYIKNYISPYNIINALMELKRERILVLLSYNNFHKEFDNYFSQFIKYFDHEQISFIIPEELKHKLYINQKLPSEITKHTQVVIRLDISEVSVVEYNWKPTTLLLMETPKITKIRNCLRKHVYSDMVLFIQTLYSYEQNGPINRRLVTTCKTRYKGVHIL